MPTLAPNHKRESKWVREINLAKAKFGEYHHISTNYFCLSVAPRRGLREGLTRVTLQMQVRKMSSYPRGQARPGRLTEYSCSNERAKQCFKKSPVMLCTRRGQHSARSFTTCVNTVIENMLRRLKAAACVAKLRSRREPVPGVNRTILTGKKSRHCVH